MSKKAALSKCDMSVRNERGHLERFLCESDDDFRVKAYQYCAAIWKSKSIDMQHALMKDLRKMMEKFTYQGLNSFELCGLVFAPSTHFASS